jgi:hypothetical protein
MRSGTTLIEVLVASVVGLLVLGAMAGLMLSVRKMSHASDLSSTMQEASLAMASIHRDLTLAVQKPDPRSDSPVVVKADAFEVLQNKLERNGSVRAKLVTYQAVRSEGGHFRLRRRSDGEERLLPGIYSAISFTELEGAGGPFVRVTMRLSVHDSASADASKGSESAVLTALVRVSGPELVNSDFFTWGFLDSLRAIEFSKDL